jgi:hypothetical protein
MNDRRDGHRVLFDAIGDDIARPGDHKLARARLTPLSTEIWLIL